MTDDIREWLVNLGLGEHIEAFVENEVDQALLPELTNEDLKDLGITKLRHRKTLLAAIRDLELQGPNANEDAAPADEPPVIAPQAERRQLTVMFVDLVGSTAMSSRIDPEEMRDVLTEFQNVVAGAVTRFDGQVAKYMGDGVLCYFGWPNAHEDDAERAVRAGLGILRALQKVKASNPDTLAARIGVATGLVIVGDLIGKGAAQEEAVVGETPNLAARMQGLAHPGELVMSETSRRLLGGAFEVIDLGKHALKGIPGEVSAYQVTGESIVETRFEARYSGSHQEMVGRDHELGLVLDRWNQAKAGDGQLLLLSGEAGIGKSRIGRAVIDAVTDEPHIRIGYQCSPYHAESTLYPAIEQLTFAAGISAPDSNEERLDKLEALLVSNDTPLIAALMGLDVEKRYGPLGLTPQQQRIRTLEALTDELIALSQDRPVLFVIEDAHWIDPSTLDLLDLCVDRIAIERILMLITARPTFDHGFGGHPNVIKLMLNRLGREQVAAIIANVAGEKPLPDELINDIADRTDGVPLFVEELTKALLESDQLVEGEAGYNLAGPLERLAIPTTLHDSLMARLDRLGTVKEIAQIGAVIGREFSNDLISTIAPQSGSELDRSLEQLIASELVFRRGTPSNIVYVFKHALVQDTAYESLLRGRRQNLHAQIATSLAGKAETPPEILAHHYSEAGLKEDAVPHWQEAGERAAKRSSNAEAVAHLNRALDLLNDIAESQERDSREFELLIKLGPPLMQSLGWSDPKVREIYERAQHLCQGSDRPEDIFMATWGLWMHKQARSEHHDAEAITDRLLISARQSEHTDLLLQANHSAWTTYLYTGRPVSALQYIDDGIGLYDAEAHGHHALLYAGHDPAVCGYCQKAMALWLLGYPDQASKNIRQGLSLAEDLKHVPTIAHAINFAARLESMRRSPVAAASYAKTAIAIGEELNLPVSRFQSGMVLGWARVHAGDTEAGLVQLGDANAKRRMTKHRSGAPHYLGIYGEACLIAKRLADANKHIEHGLHLVAETGECLWEAELLRIQGEICRQQGAPDEAEKQLREAMKTAECQGAKALELRAAMSLARLLAEHGMRRRASDLLGPVYGWFTEGRDTPDMIEAKALVDDLN